MKQQPNIRSIDMMFLDDLLAMGSGYRNWWGRCLMRRRRRSTWLL